MAKHCVELLAEKSEKIITDIKNKYKDNKALARQIIAGARETADYSCDDKRWSGSWYILYIEELEKRL